MSSPGTQSALLETHIMALADLLNRKPQSPLEKARSVVDKLIPELADAEARAEQANSAWSEAVLEEVGTADTRASDRLEREWQSARREVEKKAAALKAARIHLTLAESEGAAKEFADTWGAVDSASAVRTKAIAKLALSAEVFAADYVAALAATAALNDALPSPYKNADPDAALLWAAHVELAVRKELAKHGVDWAFSAPLGKVSLPEFLPQFKGAETVVARWKAEATAKTKAKR